MVCGTETTDTQKHTSKKKQKYLKKKVQKTLKKIKKNTQHFGSLRKKLIDCKKEKKIFQKDCFYKKHKNASLKNHCDIIKIFEYKINLK